MIALVQEREVQNRVAEAMEKEGFPVIRTGVGGREAEPAGGNAQARRQAANKP